MFRRVAAIGTFRTWRDVRLESVMRTRTDIDESDNSKRDDVSVSLRAV
jgi:hypothetical protein